LWSTQSAISNCHSLSWTEEVVQAEKYIFLVFCLPIPKSSSQTLLYVKAFFAECSQEHLNELRALISTKIALVEGWTFDS